MLRGGAPSVGGGVLDAPSRQSAAPRIEIGERSVILLTPPLHRD